MGANLQEKTGYAVNRETGYAVNRLSQSSRLEVHLLEDVFGPNQGVQYFKKYCTPRFGRFCGLIGYPSEKMRSKSSMVPKSLMPR